MIISTVKLMKIHCKYVRSNENNATENWNRKNKKTRKSYLFPNPHLNHLDTNKKHKTKSFPFIKMGYEQKF